MNTYTRKSSDGYGRKDYGNKGGFQKKSWGNDRGDRGGFGDRGPREMFKATCAECNKTCDVPFRPNGEKPVYCNDCFGSHRETSTFTTDRPARVDSGSSYGDRRSSYGEKKFDRPAFDAPAAGGSKFIERKIDTLLDKVAELTTTVSTLSYEVKKIRDAEQSTKQVSAPVEASAVVADEESAQPAKKVAKKATKKVVAEDASEVVAEKPAKKVAKKATKKAAK